MNKKLYIVLFLLSLVMTALTILVSVKGTAGTDNSIFNSPYIVFLFATYVVIQIICIINIRGKLTLYRIGFYVLHIGIVLMFLGMYLYYIKGDKLNVNIVTDGVTYNKVKTDTDGEEPDLVVLDFYIGVSDFKVEKYEDGSDKYYEATLVVEQMGQAQPRFEKLTVNHPITINKWKIYLMGYDGYEGDTVSIMLKYNPGEYVTLAGIWMLIVGAVIMCLLRKKGD